MQSLFLTLQDVVQTVLRRKKRWRTVAWRWLIGWQWLPNLAMPFLCHFLPSAVASCSVYLNPYIANLSMKQKMRESHSILWLSRSWLKALVAAS